MADYPLQRYEPQSDQEEDPNPAFLRALSAWLIVPGLSLIASVTHAAAITPTVEGVVHHLSALLGTAVYVSVMAEPGRYFVRMLIGSVLGLVIAVGLAVIVIIVDLICFLFGTSVLDVAVRRWVAFGLFAPTYSWGFYELGRCILQNFFPETGPMRDTTVASPVAMQPAAGSLGPTGIDLETFSASLMTSVDDLMRSAGNEPVLTGLFTRIGTRMRAAIVERHFQRASQLLAAARAVASEWERGQEDRLAHQVKTAELQVKLEKLSARLTHLHKEGSWHAVTREGQERSATERELKVTLGEEWARQTVPTWRRLRQELEQELEHFPPEVRERAFARLDAIFLAGPTEG